MTDWRPDVLGDEFECTDLNLGEENGAPLVATLVRALPRPLSFWDRLWKHTRMLEDVDVLYVHGWNDYFFQKSLARFYTERGARFFAIDLRRYGRSLREGDDPGYVDDLSDYFVEIDLALSLIQGAQAPHTDEVPHGAQQRRLLLLGHSTGGLVVSLWADKNRGRADALMLNSPWLELQISSVARKALAPVMGLRAKLSPKDLALPQLDLGFYSHALRNSCTEEELAIINRQWRPDQAPQVRTGWLSAIIVGQSTLNEGIDVGAPVCVLLSQRSHFGLSWDDEMSHTDTVLEVGSVARSSLKLGSSVTIERIDGAVHDVFLSSPEPRKEAFDRMERWLRGWNAAVRP
jgi:alpha-beta hydrolase superfamily lysophospholipase